MFESLLKRNFWQSLFTATAGSGRTKYTFEELRALSDVLSKNQFVTEANRALVVETIRSIAEFMIWGDQNEPRIFEFFLENNIMLYLHRVLQQPANRTGDVAKQVLQTLSIIIQNIRSETGTYFLFSNNHINNIVEIRFDFEDEEVLGYYISFLKTISLKLNAGTVQFFFDGRDSEYTFPLYSEAVKFAHHKEGMVRAGVRTLTLNVYSVPDPYIQDYVCRPPATSYVAEMVGYIAEQVKILDKRMAAAEGFNAQVLSSLDSQLAEVEDMVSYVADILTTAPPRLAHLVAQQLWVALVGPYLLRPLVGSKGAKPSKTGTGGSGGGATHGSPGTPGQPVRVACALYCLERLFMLITYPPLLHNLALAVLDPRVGHPSCRPAMAALLRSEDHRSVSGALRCLVALVHNRHVAPELMALLGLVPRQRTADLHTACSAKDCAACRLREQLLPLPQDCAVPGMPPDPLAEEPQPVATSTVADSGVGSGAGSDLVFGYHVTWTSMQVPARAPLAQQDHNAGGEVGDISVSEANGEAAGELDPLQQVRLEGDGQGQERSPAGGTSTTQDEAQAGPLSGDSLPAIIQVASATHLQYSATGSGQGTSEDAAGSAAVDLLGPEDPGGAGGGEALQLQLSGSQPQGQQEADLLGLDDLLPGAASGSGTDAAAAANTDAQLPAAEGTSAVVAAADTGDLLDMGPEDASAANCEPSEAQPAVASVDPLAATGHVSPLDAVAHSPAEELAANTASRAADDISSALAETLALAEPSAAEAPSAPAEDAAASSAGAPDPAAATAGTDGGSLSSLLDMLPQAAAAAAAVAATALASTSAALGDPLGASNPVAEQRSASSSGAPASAALGPSAETTAEATGSAAPSVLESSAAGTELNSAPPQAPAPPASEPAVTGPPCAVHARTAAVASSSDLLDALFALLSMQLLPVPGLCNVGLLLSQLYPRAEERRELEELLRRQQQELLSKTSSADQIADLLDGGDDNADGLAAVEDSAEATNSPLDAPEPEPSLPEPQSPAPHPLDPSSTAGWACELSATEREALRVASVSAASAVLDEVGGMWCDALVAMMAMEWPAAHDAVTRPSLRASAEQLMAGPHLYPQQHARVLSGPGRNEQGLSGSAVAALHSYHAVCRLVALLHVHDLLQRGATGRRPPPSCPLPQSGDVEGRPWDVQEGQEVELQAGSAIPCIVSFAPGQERRVYFAAAGPALRGVTEYLHEPQALLSDPSAQAAVLHSSPAVVLADPAPTRLNAGVVLSVSPLLGSEPSLDKNVAKWLHVHVRPSVRGLLRLLRSAAAGRKGGLLAAVRHLADGHWVLAFPDAERAASARQLVEQSAHRLRALYCELLSPVLGAVME